MKSRLLIIGFGIILVIFTFFASMSSAQICRDPGGCGPLWSYVIVSTMTVAIVYPLIVLIISLLVRRHKKSDLPSPPVPAKE